MSSTTKIGLFICCLILIIMSIGSAAGGYYAYTNDMLPTIITGTTTAPITVAPTTTPITVAPTTIPITVAPTIIPITVAPTTKPITVAPTTKPITVAPTTIPITMAPTTIPITTAPTTIPITVAPTTKPITVTPATIPITVAPTTKPITVAPTTTPWCTNGTYCDGVPVPQNEAQVGAVVCGGGNRQYACNSVNGTAQWNLLGQICTAGMKNMCSIAPQPSMVSQGISYLGCYNDKEIRALPTVATSQNLTQCFNSAKASGSKYFALQYGDAGSGIGQCFYGDSSLTLAQAQQYGKNDQGCSAMATPTGSFMGGTWTNALYQSG